MSSSEVFADGSKGRVIHEIRGQERGKTAVFISSLEDATESPSSRAQHPGGSDGCVRRQFPRPCRLPRFAGEPASGSSLSRPVQASREVLLRRKDGIDNLLAKLEYANDADIQRNSANTHPFVWRKKADDTCKKVRNCKAILETLYEAAPSPCLRIPHAPSCRRLSSSLFYRLRRRFGVRRAARRVRRAI